MRRVLLTGNQTVKTIDSDEYACMKAEVVPSLVVQDGKDRGHDMIEMGIILSCTPLRILDPAQEGDDDTYKPFEVEWITSAFIDPIRWWRTMHLLEALPVIKEEPHYYFDLYVAAGRRDAEDHKSDYEQRIIQEIRSLLEDGAYEEIMSRPIPLNVVQLLITLVDEGYDLHLAVACVSNEIAAGTIRWSQELKRIGVQHPDYLRAINAAKQQLITRYEAFLCSYAAFANWKKKGPMMISVEWRLYDCVERGIEEQYGQGIAIMLGAFLVQVETDDIYEQLGKESPMENLRHFLRPSIQSRCEEVVNWFLQSFPDAHQGTTQEYGEIIQRLYRQWDQLPVVTPLVS